MVNEPDYPENYPKTLIQGDNVARVFEAVKQRLITVFPQEIFKHVVLPPSPKESAWKQVFTPAPVVALGMSEWRASRSAGQVYRGDLFLPVVILLRSANPADLYLGTGRLREPGVVGVMAILAGAIQGWTIKNIGTCEIRTISLPETAEWFDDNSTLIAAEIQVSNVALDNIEALASLNEFAGLMSNQVRMENEECECLSKS